VRRFTPERLLLYTTTNDPVVTTIGLGRVDPDRFRD
jgi:hypothetical protein